MGSAWGLSWGNSWGNSWGTTVPPPRSTIAFAADGAYGSSNVTRFVLPNTVTPVAVGSVASILVSSNLIFQNNTGLTMVLTRPDGTTVRLVYPLVYVGTVDCPTGKGIFVKNTYAVGTVRLDQAGVWSVYVSRFTAASGQASFLVSPD